jgi:hypothetical protein
MVNGWIREGPPRETIKITKEQRRKFSSKGGQATAAKITKEQRREFSSKGGQAAAIKRRQQRDGDGAV